MVILANNIEIKQDFKFIKEKIIIDKKIERVFYLIEIGPIGITGNRDSRDKKCRKLGAGIRND